MTWAPEPDNRFSPSDREAAAERDWADALARFASDARTDERVAERRRQRGLDEQAAASSTFAGLLENLAESGSPIHVVTTTGTGHRGTIGAVGSDAVVLRTGPSRRVVVAMTAIAHLDAPAGRYGDRPAPTGRPALGQLLAELVEQADHRAEIVCTAHGGVVVTGRLGWLGEDVLAVEPGGRSCRYMRLSSLIEVSLSVSG